jgi:hypothetical protein
MIDREKFREFLRQKTRADEVFLTADTCNCPLSVFLRTQGDAQPRVYSESYLRDANHVPAAFQPLDACAMAFVAEVDTFDSRMIHAADALKILEGVA